MPYTVQSPPEQLKGLPKHLIEIWVAAFNAAFKQYSGDEGKSAGTAWAAVKNKYRKNEQGQWVAKEAAMISDEQKRNLLQTALISEYGLKIEDPVPKNVSIEEVFDSEIIYNIDGQLYQSSYELGEAGAVFGEPKKVLSTKIFKPMESLQERYSELIQEAGKRNANLDSARIKKIVELCQELLSSDEADEGKTKEALVEADTVLTWLKEQAVMKTEDGVKFPASAFAYVPNTEDASTWKLRVWENPEKKVTRNQLRLASASLSAGGRDGKKENIPAADLAAIKRKIRAEYRKLGVEEADIPPWMKESETRELVFSYTPLTEAKFDKGRATVIVIKPGFNATEDRYYPAEMLKRDYKIFEGQKMYADHPTEAEDEARPERSIKDWVATLSEVTCDEAGVVTGIAEIVEPWLMQKLASLRDKNMLSEMGISINAVGSATKGTIEGKETLVIEKLVAARSVDFVTEPGAGGIVTMYESKGQDIDLIELATLKERRPDLIKTVEANIRADIAKEVKKAMENEDKIKDLEGQIATLTTERDSLKEAAEKAEKDKVKAEAQATIKEAVDKAELPDAAKARLIERFKDAETADGITEAIEDKKAEIAELAEAGHVKGLGGSKPDTEKDKEALKESFKRLNPEWTDAQVETAVTGR